MTAAEKVQAAYHAASNQDTVEGNLRATNFHTFLHAIKQCVGGSHAQLGLIRNQIDLTLRALPFDTIISHECQKVYDANKLLGIPLSTQEYMSYFMNAFKPCYERKYQAFCSDMDLGALREVFVQLKEYHAFIQHMSGDVQEGERIFIRMERLVGLQIRLVLKHSGKPDRLSSFFNQPIIDWDCDAGCWMLSLPKCAEHVNGVPYDEQSKFFMAPKEGNDRVKSKTNSNSKRRQNKRKHNGGAEEPYTHLPPRDCAHHWTPVIAAVLVLLQRAVVENGTMCIPKRSS